MTEHKHESNAPQPPRERIWFAQMLRGLACLAVVYSHLGWGFWLENNHPERAYLVKPLDPQPAEPPPHAVYHLKHTINHLAPGFLGVSLFFLISGFVIPMSLEKYGCGAFLFARVLRIFPVLWTVIAFNVLVLSIYWSIYGDGFAQSWGSVLANAGLVSPYLRHRWLDSVSWTLALEMLFYVLCAGMYFCGLFQKKRGVLLTGLGLLTFSATTGWYYSLAHKHGGVSYWVACHLSYDACYLLYLMVGTCFYRLYRKQWSLPATAGVITVLMIFWHYASRKHLMMAGHWPSIERTFIISLFGFTCCFFARNFIPYSRVLNYLAEISYPLYLIHPVVGYILLTVNYQNGLATYPNLALTFAVVVTLAAVLHHTVEVPVNRLGRRLADRLSGQKPQPPSIAVAEKRLAA
jgi:peptidoglycan/LPS O-acetylase OafA/YrhL